MLRILAAGGRIAWQVVGIAIVLWIAGQVFEQLSLVFLAVFVALVIAAATAPLVAWLERLGLGRTLASALCVTSLVVVLVAVTGFLVVRVADEAPRLVEAVRAQQEPVLEWLERSPLRLSEEEVTALLDRGLAQVDSGVDGTDVDLVLPDDAQGPSPTLAVAVLSPLLSATQLIGFLLLGVVLAFFLARDRDLIAHGVVHHLVGGDHDQHAERVFRRSWEALIGYVRAALLVGAVDAALFGIVLVLVGVPLAGVLTALTFLAAFVPVVGAIVVGVVAAAVALVAGGVADALVVAAAMLVVQQVDSNLLQPVVMRHGTGLHPIATILALTVGGTLGGVLGALLAVPAAAVVVAAAAAMLEVGTAEQQSQVEDGDDGPRVTPP